MGIPSYYKKLADHTKGLVGRSHTGTFSGLYFDFNCMIYHCARRSNTPLPPYPGPEGQAHWETLLLEDLVKYILKVWASVGKPREVFLAVDGVVPMAKIKQQRLRRFKSVWLAEAEREEGLRDTSPRWDTNCLTPGTSFMKRLTARLQKLCSAHPQWSVSGTDEPGEGEHKIMAKLRAKEASSDPVCIYGLDADLILLTLLNAKSPAYLVREDAEMGVPILDGLGEEQFSFFSVDVLKQTIPSDLPSYVAAMSLLGNDFLPHSCTVKMREDGHASLVKGLRMLEQEGIPFLIPQGSILQINHDAVWRIISHWASEESDRLLRTLKKKLQMRGRSERTLDNRPLEWMVEQGMAWKAGDDWKLTPSWAQIYRSKWLVCETRSDILSVCREYLFGLQWVLDYYTGQAPVEMTWSFSRLVPPLWTDLQQFLETEVYEPFVFQPRSPIQPSEQLAMVLPQESWYLLEDPKLRELPTLLPQFWPLRFEFFSACRTKLWECEPLLPSLTIDRVRDL